MTFHAKLSVDQGTATIRLSGELSSPVAGQLNQLIAEAARQSVDRLVLLTEQLTYISSAGLRCLAVAHQKFGPSVPIVLVGVHPEVAETIRLTGLDRTVIMQDTLETR
jgi:anti-anti-sigma factor